MCRAVVFDFDGTLVDSYSRRNEAHEAVRDVLVEFLTRKGIPVSERAVLEEITDAERTAGRTRDWDRDEWWVTILAEHGVTDPPAQVVRRATHEYWETTLAKTTTYPGVASMLERLARADVPIGLISDTDGLEGMKDRRLAKSGIAEYFDAVVVAGEETAEPKPSVEPFERVAAELNVPPTDCLYVGDNPHTDVAGARETGMTTVLVTWESALEGAAEPDHVVDEDVDAVAELVFSLL